MRNLQNLAAAAAVCLLVDEGLHQLVHHRLARETLAFLRSHPPDDLQYFALAGLG